MSAHYTTGFLFTSKTHEHEVSASGCPAELTNPNTSTTRSSVLVEYNFKERQKPPQTSLAGADTMKFTGRLTILRLRRRLKRVRRTKVSSEQKPEIPKSD